MSCFKIVIGFYQVVAGIFSALARIRWPVALISMEKYLKLFEGNILQFAPLSCIHSRFRIDHFVKFLGVISLNIFFVCVILLYLFVNKRYIKNKLDYPDSKKDICEWERWDNGAELAKTCEQLEQSSGLNEAPVVLVWQP